VKVLVVRLRQIGDVVFTTPALAALRRQFPGVAITYLVEPAAAAVLTGNPNIDDLLVCPASPGLNGWRAGWGLIRQLRARRFDLAIDFHGGPRASLITWLSGARRRIGYDVVGRAWMYTDRVARARTLRPRHSVENQWDLLTPLGIASPSPTADPVFMAVDEQVRRVVAERLASAGVNPSAPLIVMHVSAGNPFRRWPIPAFAEVAASLAVANATRRILVTSGPSDQDAAAAVINAARVRLGPAAAHQLVACGEFTLTELRALTDSAALFIGGDSGPMHVAATSRVPIVTLYGPTLPARSAPWRTPTVPAEALEVLGLPCRPCDQRVCVPGDFRCLTWIRPDQVVEAAERALSHPSG
jgi:lipopolysaccharide heptosyltransferase II